MSLGALDRARGPVLAAAVIALATVTAPAASAQTLSLRDPAGDVQKFDPAGMGHSTAADHPDGDLRRLTVRYDSRRIVIVETFRELDHSEPVLAIGGSVRMPSGRSYDLVVKAQAGSWAGRSHLAGHPNCAVRHHLDYERNLATVVVPATCLKNPRWIRFQAAAVTTDSWSKPTYFYVDTAPGGPMADKYTGRIQRG